MTVSRITVLLVDDHAVVRAGYRHLLERDGRIMVVGEAADVPSAYGAFCKLAPQVTVMDIALPGASGVEALKRILTRAPGARVLMFSMYAEAIYAEHALRGGARGYLTKRSAPEELVEAVLAVARGEVYLSRDVAQALALRGGAAREALSVREFEILRLLASGSEVAEIATRLQISEKTVANYQSALKQKLRARNSVQLLRRAWQIGLLAADDGALRLP
ncbi:MAG: response regulator transcription factor [Burkholderiaceae bacterium]|nr:response regulator transcription factor [Burkholderiaceae bacterium]